MLDLANPFSVSEKRLAVGALSDSEKGLKEASSVYLYNIPV